MSYLDIILLSVALAMDCFAVSIVSGILVGRWRTGVFLTLGLLFGAFQAFMPLAGWLCMSRFSESMQGYDHWIAFGLLLFLGGRMVKESLGAEENHSFDPTKPLTQIVLAVATSIDALAVGISFACLDYKSLADLTLPLITIGVVSLAFSLVGSLLGVRFGDIVAKRVKPELFGGIILILIGVKVLLSHLLGL